MSAWAGELDVYMRPYAERTEDNGSPSVADLCGRWRASAAGPTPMPVRRWAFARIIDMSSVGRRRHGASRARSMNACLEALKRRSCITAINLSGGEPAVAVLPHKHLNLSFYLILGCLAIRIVFCSKCADG